MRTRMLIAALSLNALAGCSTEEGTTPTKDTGILAPPAPGEGVQYRMTSTIDPGQEVERCMLVKAPPEGLFVKRDAESAKKLRRIVCGESAQNAADDGASPAPEITFRDDSVGDVTTRAAADQYFGAWMFRAIEYENRPNGVGAPRKDCGCKSGGAGADYDDIRRRTHAVIQSTLGTPRRSSQRVH